MMRKTLADLFVIVLLLLLPLLMFGPVAVGHRTLLPADALFLFEPYRSAAAEFGVSFPYNHLVSDLILENYAWKRFLVQAIQRRELPLWDPYIFAGHPFLANGQHSGLYPLSVVFYLLPLWRAYGVFACLQLGLAGVFAYLLARVLGIRPLGSLITGVTFQFSGFMLISATPHPMNVAGASWLPFILAMVELIVQQRPLWGRRPATLPWALLGAVGLGCQMLVGHAENTGFVLLVTGAFAAWRLFTRAVGSPYDGSGRGWRDWLKGKLAGLPRALVGLTLMALLGLALGAVQFVPLFEVVRDSFRGGEAAATLEQVRGWAYPPRHLIAFAIPNFFGGPTQHGYWDLFTGRWSEAPTFADGQYIDWGVKNAVEGAAYLGLLPLLLAAIAVISSFTACSLAPFPSTNSPSAPLSLLQRFISRLVRGFRHPYIPFFTLLSLFSLGCIFGTPLYALVYVLPLFNQSHSPFRWVFPLTLCVAVLAGFGAEVVGESRARFLRPGQGGAKRSRGHWLLLQAPVSLVALLSGLAFWGGLFTLAALALSRAFFARLEPLVERVFLSLARAPEAFPDHRAFYSYEFRWAAIFGLLLAASGIVLRISFCSISLRRRPVWEFLAVGVLVLDLCAFGAGFAPAVDPALVTYTPPVVEFLRQDSSLWRYATFTPPGTTKTMNDNVGMFYDFQTVSGYDSLFSRQYADYMELIEPQGELLYNRIASFHEWSSLDSPLTDLLNVKYIITEVEIPNPRYRLVYQDRSVRVYENLGVMPRAFALPLSATLATSDFAAAVQSYDPRYYVIVDSAERPVEAGAPQPAAAIAQPVAAYTLNEVVITATISTPSWLVLADSYFPGWKAFARPVGTFAEQELDVYRVNGNFRGVRLDPGVWVVRFKYSPDSVKIGAFISFLAVMTLLFLLGLYLWRFFYRQEDDASAVRRIAKNSIAPIALNLFNRAIDLAFAALMARILGPVGNGRFAWAAGVYLWFDTIANFGLDMVLMREAARDKAQARRLFVNTTVLRLLLFVGVIPLLAGFLIGWQALGARQAAETIWTLVLLYVALLPGSVANGVAALFRACEKHEYPAAIQTVTTVIKVTLGVVVLVSGLRIVGLAGVSIVNNLATLGILWLLGRRLIWPTLPRGETRVAWPLLRSMVIESWPLMLSLLLQILFPGVNLLLLNRFQGDAVVGWYDAGRKWIDMLNIIPSVFTFAAFPVLARQAAQDLTALRRSYSLSAKVLTMAALPSAALVALLATPLVGLLSGSEFLPHGAVVLRLLAWSVVFGWLNSLTNYVLIALHRQRYVLATSGARVAFTIAANLLLVRRFSYVASAGIIIAGELLLLTLFTLGLRRHIGAVHWARLLWRPALAGAAMGGVAWGVSLVNPALALIAGLLVYLLALVALRALSAEERQALAPLLPGPLRRLSPTPVVD